MLAVVFRSSYIKHLAAIGFLLTAGLSISTIAQAFMTTAYDLTQTDQAYILVGLASVFVFWSVMSVPLIKKFGNRKMFAFGLTSMTIASLMLVGAPYSMWCFFGCLLPMTAAVVASPALLSLLSKQVLPGDQAKLQAATMALSLIASAVIQPIYSALFSYVGSGKVCDVTTGLDSEETIDSAASSYAYLAWLPFGLAAMCGITMFCIGVRWLLIFPLSDDDIVSGAVQTPEEPGVSNRVAPATSDGSAPRSPGSPVQIETNPDVLAMMDASNVFKPNSRRPSMYQEMQSNFQSPVVKTDKEEEVLESSPLRADHAPVKEAPMRESTTAAADEAPKELEASWSPGEAEETETSPSSRVKLTPIVEDQLSLNLLVEGNAARGASVEEIMVEEVLKELDEF